MTLTDLYTHPGDGRINLYWRRTSGTGLNTWFNYGGVSGYALSSWLSLTNDPSFGLTQSVSSTSKPTFAEKRRIPDYAAHIGLSPQVSAFESALLGQRKGNWDPRLTAEYAIDWIRQGYGMAPLLSSGGGSSPTTPVYKFMYNGNKIYTDSQGRVLFLTYN